LNGRVLDEADTQWLHSLEFKEFAENSADAIQLLRSVTVGERCEFVDKCPALPDPMDTPSRNSRLSERQMEFLDSEFTRENRDAINDLLDGTGVSQEEALHLLLQWRQQPT